MKQRVFLSIVCIISLFAWGSSASPAQPQLPQTQQSPAATISQTVGISNIEVVYHRPGVKGRTVWGSLVPYGEVWRAGANENTTIRFSHDLKVEGQTLQAGTYGLHMIPTSGTWTIIFSKNSTSWGSFFYNQVEDALRVTVAPQPADFHEWLQYEFSDLSDSSAVLSLFWEKLRVPIKLSFDTPGLTMAEARNTYLRGLAGFGWQGFNQAAQYAVRNTTDLAQAMKWVDQSIGLNENFNNLRTKATILDKMGKTAEATALRDKSMKLATEADLNILGYTYMNGNKMKEAIEVFESNVKAHPESWNVYDSLGEALQKKGDKSGAIKNYEKALKMVGDDQNRKRITGILTKLK